MLLNTIGPVLVGDVMSRTIAGCNICLLRNSRIPSTQRNARRTLLLSATVFMPESDQAQRKECSASSVKRVSSFYDRYVFPEPPNLISEEEHENVVSKVNSIMEDPGRLFAVVNMTGQQYKVTVNDIISISGRIPAECGEKIRLEKVSLVGGSEFTLVGRPIVPRNLVKIEATVIEKTPSVDMIVKKFTRRKQFERTHRFNSLHTLLRINSIKVYPKLL